MMTDNSLRSPKPFLIGWCICLVVLELLGMGFARNKGAYDFQAFYAAGYLVRTQPSDLYNLSQQASAEKKLTPTQGFLAFYHPPYEALVYAPFSLMPFGAAYLSYIGLNMVLLLAAFFAARPAFSSVIPWWQPRPGLMLFFFLPMLFDIILGQDSILVLLFCCLTWRQLEAEKEISAGCFLALALFKFQIILPIAVLIAIRRSWRFSAGFAATAVAIVLFCAGMLRSSGLATLTHLFFSASSAVGQNAIAQYKVSVFPSQMPNITGLLYACGGRFLTLPFAFEVLSGVAALALFIWCAWIIRRCDHNTAFSLAILCGLLANYHIYSYDVTLVLLALSLMANRIPRYILMAMFAFPIALIFFGHHWFSLMAIPLLAMLVSIRVSIKRAVQLTPPVAKAAVA